MNGKVWLSVILGTLFLLVVGGVSLYFLSTPAQRISFQNFILGKKYKEYTVTFVNPTFKYEDVASRPDELTKENQAIVNKILEQVSPDQYLLDPQNPIGANPVLYISLTPDGYNTLRHIPEVTSVREYSP